MTGPRPYQAPRYPHRHDPPSTTVDQRAYRDDPPSNPPPTWQPTEAQLAAFGRTVLSWHQIVTAAGSQSPMCTCHSWAVLCPYVRAARDTMRMPVPWDTHRPPLPYREA